MRHRNPSGALDPIFKLAIKDLRKKLEKEIYAETRAPSKASRASRTRVKATKKGHVSRATRREVFARDGKQCTYRAPDGTRCTAESLIELDHVEPRALGGSDAAENLRVTCRAHNQMYATQKLGTKASDFKKTSPPRAKPPTPTPPPPLAPAPAPPIDTETLDRAKRGLTFGLGFGARDAERALGMLASRYAGGAPPPIETIMRDAIGLLT